MTAAAICAAAAPAAAHHSYAMYDATKVLTVTGVTVSFLPQSAHAELRMYLLGPDGKLLKRGGKNVEFGIEMAVRGRGGSAGRQRRRLPVGTIFSVRVNPMRTGEISGRGSARSPNAAWKTAPQGGADLRPSRGRAVAGRHDFQTAAWLPRILGWE